MVNGHPEHVTKPFMAKKMKQFHALLKCRPERCPFYLRLPLLSSVSSRFENQVKSVVKHCFSAVERRVVYSTNERFPLPQRMYTASFTEKLRDLSLLMPLWQSVLRPYLPNAAGHN